MTGISLVPTLRVGMQTGRSRVPCCLARIFRIKGLTGMNDHLN
ncbi:MAG: hypothetical protein AB7S75_15080 [Desulfococcaceae bacterium]